MNILYISNLSGNLWAGPNNSVPAQIRAQAKIDNVFWFNINHNKREEWTQDGLDCKNLDDFPSGRLKDLPAPFNCPDIVVVEEFYCFPFCKILKDVKKRNIPYVIIPRSEMTCLAQKNKFLKKKIGNLLYFNSLAKHAAAIEYLTENEKKESEKQWKTKGFVIPNGVNLPNVEMRTYSNDQIVASYIGRIDIYQKGLDILVDAISGMKDDLTNNNFHLTIYGPNREGSQELLQEKIKKLLLEDLISFEEAVFGLEKAKVLLQTDVFIMTSRFEGMPMGMIEALSYGVPCLATTGTNFTKEINDFNAGWIAENNVESVKNALRSVIFRRGFTSKGKNALQLAENFSWDTIAKDTSQCYERILG